MQIQWASWNNPANSTHHSITNWTLNEEDKDDHLPSVLNQLSDIRSSDSLSCDILKEKTTKKMINHRTDSRHFEWLTDEENAHASVSLSMFWMTTDEEDAHASVSLFLSMFWTTTFWKKDLQRRWSIIGLTLSTFRMTDWRRRCPCICLSLDVLNDYWRRRCSCISLSLSLDVLNDDILKERLTKKMIDHRTHSLDVSNDWLTKKMPMHLSLSRCFEWLLTKKMLMHQSLSFSLCFERWHFERKTYEEDDQSSDSLSRRFEWQTDEEDAHASLSLSLSLCFEWLAKKMLMHQSLSLSMFWMTNKEDAHASVSLFRCFEWLTKKVLMHRSLSLSMFWMTKRVIIGLMAIWMTKVIIGRACLDWFASGRSVDLRRKWWYAGGVIRLLFIYIIWLVWWCGVVLWVSRWFSYRRLLAA